jgi:hypothetical protein
MWAIQDNPNENFVILYNTYDCYNCEMRKVHLAAHVTRTRIPEMFTDLRRGILSVMNYLEQGNGIILGKILGKQNIRMVAVGSGSASRNRLCKQL